MTAPSTSRRRADAVLDHPVIDTDGHLQEFMPAVLPYLREALGAPLFQSYLDRAITVREIMTSSAPERRTLTREPQGGWWALPSGNTLDRATATIPRLLHDRLDELRIDFAVLYTSNGIGSVDFDDGDLRRGLCAGFNSYYADAYGPYADRLTVAGLIPTHTPDEAIAEVDHCHDLGLKVVVVPHGVLRPIPEPQARTSRYMFPSQQSWWDTYGLDSAHDYDPLWRRIRELKMAVTAHGAFATPTNVFTSISNFTYNHVGSHFSMMYPLCKSLFLGGLPRRFPDLPFGFLECGVTWACQLLSDLVEHWERRNLDAVQNTNPARLDIELFVRLLEEYGPEMIEGRADEVRAYLEFLTLPDALPSELDDFARLEVMSKADLPGLFASNFYFGCEADDRGVGFAFSDVHPGGVHLKAIFSSDIGHWDVHDMASVVREAQGLVHKGVIDEAQLREFTFVNPAEMYLRANPDFFHGTAVENEVAALNLLARS
jgi:predicted TIM-barrel fold metal-dependent hydrolase